jgi:Uma2 family endonuclease
MSGRTQIRQGMTLEEFLKLPEDKPYLDYIDGRIEAKASWQMRQSLLVTRLLMRLNREARPAHRGLALPVLRCTFAGRSIVPDVVFLLKEHIEIDEKGRTVDLTPWPPDLHVEIIGPDEDRDATKLREKLLHSTTQGCSLGWLIRLEERTIEVFRPHKLPCRLARGGILEGEPVLPGFLLPVAEVFGWLKLWNGRRDPGIEAR